jgi:ElaB/YqjD/DUF883 family membrane-anchored ribosome-binding protein
MIDDSRHECTRLKAEVADLASALERLAEAEGAEAIETIRAKIRRLPAELTAFVEDFDKAGAAAHAVSTRGRSRLERSIRERPLAAIVLAAAAGFLLASLSRR